MELRILKHLFTPKEAQIATQLSMIQEPVERIYERVKRSGLSILQLQVILDEMVRKGSILGRKKGDKTLYRSAPLSLGMYEFQVDRLPKDFAEDWLQYLDEAYAHAQYKTGIPQLRTIPLEKSIPLPEQYQVSDYDDVKKLVENARKTLTNIKYNRDKLDAIERKGMSAHEKKDRREWTRIHDEITDLEIKQRDKPSGVLPTFIHKLLASAQVLQHMEQVDRKLRKISEQGEVDNWKDEIERIRKGLEKALTRIQDVDDDIADDKGLAQIQLIFARTVGPLKKAIGDLGGPDISKL